MRFLLFSDVHARKYACKSLVKKSRDADLVIGAGIMLFLEMALGKH